jgi:DNA-binding transcriptional MerR regulator
MEIAEVAKRSGVAGSPLRFHEEKGLMGSARCDALRRRFAPGVLGQLALIPFARSAGFSIVETRSMFSVAGRPAPSQAECMNFRGRTGRHPVEIASSGLLDVPAATLSTCV